MRSTLMCVRGRGWQSGIRADVCLAAMIPASRAVCSGSPLATSPRRISRSAAALMTISPRASASRFVEGFPPTSTMRALPLGSMWDSGTFVPQVASRRSQGASGQVSRTYLLLATGDLSLLIAFLALRQVKRQALERYRQVHALQLDLGRHLQRAG